MLCAALAVLSLAATTAGAQTPSTRSEPALSSSKGQAYPTKPVRIIVPFGPGGAADFLPRLIGAKLTEMWAQPIVVDNRTGAAGNIGMNLGAKAAPDGYRRRAGREHA